MNHNNDESVYNFENSNFSGSSCCFYRWRPCCCICCPTWPPGPPIPPILPGIAYGGLYGDTSQFITIEPGGEKTVELEEEMPASNVTLGTNSITIDVPGTYRVEFFLLFQSATGRFGITAGVKINGFFGQLPLTTAAVLSSDFEMLTLSAIVTLAKNDVLTLALMSATGGSVFFGPGTNANLSVIRLGD